MKRFRSKLFATSLVAASLILLLVIWLARESDGRGQNLGLRIKFLGFTKVGGSWFAKMAVTNPTSQLHFVEMAGRTVAFQREAVVRGETNGLPATMLLKWFRPLSAESSADFQAELPEGTEQWQVNARGYRSNTVSRWLFDRLLAGGWFRRWLDRLPEDWLIWALRPSQRSRLELDSGVMTNLPPSR